VEAYHVDVFHGEAMNDDDEKYVLFETHKLLHLQSWILG
jgi:hypothetical protein